MRVPCLGQNPILTCTRSLNFREIIWLSLSFFLQSTLVFFLFVAVVKLFRSVPTIARLWALGKGGRVIVALLIGRRSEGQPTVGQHTRASQSIFWHHSRVFMNRSSPGIRNWWRAKIEGLLYALRYPVPFVFCMCSSASPLDAIPNVDTR